MLVSFTSSFKRWLYERLWTYAAKKKHSYVNGINHKC